MRRTAVHHLTLAGLLCLGMGCDEGTDGAPATTPDPAADAGDPTDGATVDPVADASDPGADAADGDTGVSDEPGEPTMGTPDAAFASTPDTLAEWNLFSDLPNQVPGPRVVPYDMNSPLFTDYAAKHRFIYLPEGEKIGYRDMGTWSFPVGTILVKTFAYPLDEADLSQGERILETRLLIHREGGWDPEVYVWNEEQTEARRDVTGETVSVTRKLADGGTMTFDYGVPTRDECRKCHGSAFPIDGAQATRPLGPMAPQLNFAIDYGNGPENQLDHLADLGWLDSAPPPMEERLLFPSIDDPNASVDERTRGYLHANCAHCHSEGGEVFDKELWLDWPSTGPDVDPFRYGVCKKPTSAGNAECESTKDIVPGDPDNSLMICRMELQGKGKMAPLGRNLDHGEGVALVRQWIAEMDFPSCSGE